MFHLLTALSGSRAYRGELVSHGPNYRNASDRPADRRPARNRLASILAHCRRVDTDSNARREALAAAFAEADRRAFAVFED